MNDFSTLPPTPWRSVSDGGAVKVLDSDGDLVLEVPSDELAQKLVAMANRDSVVAPARVYRLVYGRNEETVKVFGHKDLASEVERQAWENGYATALEDAPDLSDFCVQVPEFLDGPEEEAPEIGKAIRDYLADLEAKAKAAETLGT